MMKWKDNGTDFEFTIDEFYKHKDWCEVTLMVKNKYFNYYQKEELLETRDVQQILDGITRLLNRKMIKREVLHFTEPDISFAFYPPRLQREVSHWISLENIDSLTPLFAEMIIELDLGEGYGGEYYVVEMSQDQLIMMRDYLLEVTG